LFLDAQQADSGFVFRTRNSSNATIPALYIAPSGNVGIGEIDPEDKLEVSGGSLKIKTVASAALEPSIKLGRSDQANGNFENHISSQTGSGASQCKIQFKVCDTTAAGRTTLLTLDGGENRSYFLGSVGIGLTTTPLNTLHVAGSVRATSGVYFNSTSTIGFKIENDFTNNELDIYGGSLVAAITINNAGLLKFGNYGIGGSGTAKYVLGLDGSSNVVKATSFNTLVDDQLPTTDAAASGTIVNWSVSESTTAGLLYVVKTNGGWTTADADFEARSTYMLAIALSTDADEGMLLQGFFYKSSHGFTIGAPLYISNTAGAFSNSRPTGTNDYVRIIGYATSANYIYFDPDKTWIKLT